MAKLKFTKVAHHFMTVLHGAKRSKLKNFTKTKIYLQICFFEPRKKLQIFQLYDVWSL